MPEQPRIDPVLRADADRWQTDLFDLLGPGEPLHLFSTLAHHSKLLKDWLPLGGRLLYGGQLADRDRELVILRTSARCGSAYEWGQHVGIARGVGLSDEEILACATDEPGEALGDGDVLLLGAVDELVDDHTLGDATWDALVARFAGTGTPESMLLELTMLVGHYAMLAGLLNSVRVTTERPLPGIGTVR